MCCGSNRGGDRRNNPNKKFNNHAHYGPPYDPNNVGQSGDSNDKPGGDMPALAPVEDGAK